MAIDFQRPRTSSSQTENVPMSPCKKCVAAICESCDFGLFSAAKVAPFLGHKFSKCTSTYSDRNRLNLNAFESDARLAGLAAATPQWRRSLPKFTGGLESVLSERHAQRCGFPQCRMSRMHVLAGSAEPRHCAFLLWRRAVAQHATGNAPVRY